MVPLNPAFFQTAKIQTINFYIIHKKIPTANNLPEIHNVIAKTDITWINFLKLCEFPLIDQYRITWKGKKGLRFAKLIAEIFYETQLRSPRTKDFENIYAAIYARYWKNYGITSWNKFLEYCNLPTNRGNKWKGKMGLELAVKKYHRFKSEHGKIPNIIDLKTVFTKINEGMWIEYNIFSWNDFIKRSQQITISKNIQPNFEFTEEEIY